VRLLRQTSLTLCLCIVHFLGQRYILYNWDGKTQGIYSPECVEEEFSEVRLQDPV